VEYKASEEAYRALQTRYNAGLIDYSELIQAQYDLLNAEASLKNACVDTWKSLLKLATIRGDINIFLNQIQN
jgi:outer membrane protein TolC